MSSVSEIRSWFEVPAIAHYCYLFRAAFDLTEFEIEDFEDSLLIDGATECQETSFLPDLLARLLRGLYKTKDITSKNYDKYLNDLLDYHYTCLEGKANPVKEVLFSQLPCRAKVTILYDICHWRLEVNDIQDLLKGKEADTLRIEPIGRNGKGDTFWYFYGTRLYKESYPEDNAKLVNGEINGGRHSKKNGRAYLLGKHRKRDRKWIDSSSDYETGSDWESQDSHFTHDGSSTNTTRAGKGAWGLECSTVDEWNALADALRSSKEKNEVLLLNVIEEQYLESIPQMIEAKEKALQKKFLQESMTRRASGRIALKLVQREEEEKVLEEQRAIEEELKARETEERKKEMEEQKKKEREERLRERERVAEERRIEREKRLKHREEQKWALENPELASQIGVSFKSCELGVDPDDREKSIESKSSIGTTRDEDEYTAMFKIITTLKKHKDAWPFLEPVEESYAPQYYDIIENPMDLSTIEKKLDGSLYTNRKDLCEDVKLIFENCLAYNGSDSPYTKMSNNLERAFNKYFAKEFPEETAVSDEDYVEEDENPKKRKRSKLMKMKEMGFAKVIKPNEMNLSMTKAAFMDPRQAIPGSSPRPGFNPLQLPNGAFPPQNLMRFGNAVFPAEVLRAPVMQAQLRGGTGIYQLINAASGANTAQKPGAHPLRIAFPNRPPMLGQTVTTTPLLNLMLRSQSVATASSGQEPLQTMANQTTINQSINQLINQQAIIRGILGTTVAGGNAGQARPQLTAEQLQAVQQNIFLQQQLQQVFQLQQQQARHQLQQQQVELIQKNIQQVQQQQQQSQQHQQPQQQLLLQQQQPRQQQQQPPQQPQQQQLSQQPQQQQPSQQPQQQQPPQQPQQTQRPQQQQPPQKPQQQQTQQPQQQQPPQQPQQQQTQQQQQQQPQQGPRQVQRQSQLVVQEQQWQQQKLQQQNLHLLKEKEVKPKLEEQGDQQQQIPEKRRVQLSHEDNSSKVVNDPLTEHEAAQQKQLQNLAQKISLQRQQMQHLQLMKQHQQQQSQKSPAALKQAIEKQAKKTAAPHEAMINFIKTSKARIDLSQIGMQMTSSGPVPVNTMSQGLTSFVGMTSAAKQEKSKPDLTSQKIDELHAIIEDPMSDENRNKRISIEESNRRVRKWLNSESSYFGPPEDDHTGSKAEGAVKHTVKILNAKTEVMDHGNAMFSTKGIPPLASVGYSLPGYPTVSASLPSRDMRNQNMLHQSLPQLTKYQEGSVSKPDGVSDQQIRDIRSQIAPRPTGTKSAFHIDTLFATSNASFTFTSKSTPSAQTSQSPLKDYLSIVGSAPKGSELASLQSNASSSFEKDMAADLGARMPRSLVAPVQAMARPGALIQTIPASETRLNALATSLEDNPASFAAIPPLRVTPTASQLSPRMGFAPVQHRMANMNRSITPTRESPASRGSSMSPQASSMKTDISSTKLARQDSTKGSIGSPRVSPQNAAKDSYTHPEPSLIRPGTAPQAPAQSTNKPILPKIQFTTDFLHSAVPMQRLHFQQQQHLTEIMRNRFLENQRLAAVDMFRAPHIGAVSSQFKEEHSGSK